MPIIKPKSYQTGIIGQALAQKVVSEKASFKAQEMAKIPLANFEKNGYSVTIIRGPWYENGLLAVAVRATKDNQPVFVDNPLFFQNPPIMVPDGTVHLETAPDGSDYQVDNYIEDPLEAFKTIIIQTLEVLNK